MPEPSGSVGSGPAGPGPWSTPADAPTWPDRASPGYPSAPPTAPPPEAPTLEGPPAWTRSPDPPGPPAPPGRPADRAPRRSGGGARNAIGVVLLVVAGLSATLAVAAGWTRARVRDEDTWAATSRALAENPEVQRDVADALAVQVVAAVGVEDRLRGVLPGPLGSLADPITERTTEAIGDATLQLVRTQVFQDAWETAVRNSHEELLAALDGDGRFTAITSEGVVLDLGSTLGELRAILQERGVPFLDAIDLSGVDAQLVLVDAPGLRTVRDLLDVLDVLVVVLPVVAVVATVLGLLVARRRALALVAGGVGALAGVVLVLGVVWVGRDEAVNQLTGGVLGQGAATAVVDEVTSGIDASMAVVAVVGALVLAVGLVLMLVPRRRGAGLA